MPGHTIGGGCCCCPQVSVLPTYTTIARYNLVGDLQEVWDTGWDTHAIDLESGNLLAGGVSGKIGGFVGRSHLTLFNETAPAAYVAWMTQGDVEIEYTSQSVIGSPPTSRQRYDYDSSSTVYNLSGGSIVRGRFQEGKHYTTSVGSDFYGNIYRAATINASTGSLTATGPSYITAISDSTEGTIYGLRGNEAANAVTNGYIQFPSGTISGDYDAQVTFLHAQGDYCASLVTEDSLDKADKHVELWRVSTATKIWSKTFQEVETAIGADASSGEPSFCFVDSTGSVFVWHQSMQISSNDYSVFSKLDASDGSLVWSDSIAWTTSGFDIESCSIADNRISIVYLKSSSGTVKSYSTGDSLSSWTGIQDVYDVKSYNGNIYVCGDRRLTSSL